MNRYVERVRREERGFTLIELLVVIVILGILAGIVIFAVGAVTDRGVSAACKSDLKTVEVAVEAYRAKNGDYPATLKPDLTEPPENFLRDEDGLGATTLSKTSSAGAYTITYDPSTGAVTGDCPA